jgi:protein translocase SEC61 complex gamma subunit
MAMNIKQKLSSNFQKYLRVARLLKKPSVSEFKTISKVSAIGLLIIGSLGFVISVGMKLLFKI